MIESKTELIKYLQDQFDNDSRITDTNMFADNTSLKVGDVVSPGANGILAIASGDVEYTVVKEYTMPDGQPAVKLQCTKAE